jgi:probable O-glycosylation ligase (exosortase A-associated)
VLIAAWLYHKDEPKKLPPTAGSYLIVAFAVWVTLSTVFAVDPGSAYEMWQRVIKILFITVLTIIMLTDRERIDGLIWVIVISIGFFAVKGGLFSLASAGHYKVWGPPGSVIMDNNALAVGTIMTLPLVRYLQMTSKNKWVRMALVACMPIMVFSALSSYSRGALLAISAMACFIWAKSRKKMVFGVGIVVVAVVAFSFMPEKWFDRMQTMETYQQDSSAMGRINAWHFAFNFTVDHPIFGGGFNVFNVTPLWSRYAPDPTNPLNAHSIYFQVMAEQGFLGLILFITNFVVCFFYGGWVIRQTRSRPDLSWARDLASMAQVSLIGFAIGGAFLDLPYFDLPWHLNAILIVSRVLVQRAIRKAPAPEAATQTARPPDKAGIVPAAPAPAHGRSFLRKDSDAPAPVRSFLRRNEARSGR